MPRSLLAGSNDPMPTIFLLVGLEGSGKSYYARDLCRRFGPCRAFDDLQRKRREHLPLAEAIDFHKLKESLLRGENCILNEVHWCDHPDRFAAVRAELAALAPAHTQRVIYFENDLEQCVTNIWARAATDPGRDPVEGEKWARHRSSYYVIPDPLPEDAEIRPVYRP
jgi:hypothetical protein